MSDDTIKRSDAIKALKREKSDWNNDYNVPIDHCIERLNKVKSADRPQGEWIDDGGIEKCNQCGERKEFPHWNFCPNCGADMREREGE
jgi:hypothetical protein